MKTSSVFTTWWWVSSQNEEERRKQNAGQVPHDLDLEAMRREQCSTASVEEQATIKRDSYTIFPQAPKTVGLWLGGTHP
jgi:hypothetical protein